MTATNLHFRVQVISRGGGQSAPAASSYRSGTVVHADGRSVVASASYRSGEALHDDRRDQTFDYTRKEDVLHAEILAPESAPDWVQNRSRLWNSVEAKEKRKDAQLARDIIAALPRGLDDETYARLVREFVNDNFVRHGMVADFAIHDKNASDGGRNPHMHVMLTTRELDADGFGPKNRNWNRRELLKEWRDAFEELCNRYLDEADSKDEVSLKSYEERGIDKIPGEHLGPNAWGLEQKGQKTDKGNRNRKVRRDNKVNEIRKSWEPVFTPDNDNEPQAEVRESDTSGVGQPGDDVAETASKPPDNLRALSRSEDDATSDAMADPRAARRNSYAYSVASRAVQTSIAFAIRMARHARSKAEALMRDETSGGDPFTRYSSKHNHLRQVSRALETESDKEHER